MIRQRWSGLLVGAHCIGINNRNLKTFETSLEITAELASMAPAETTLVVKVE